MTSSFCIFLVTLATEVGITFLLLSALLVLLCSTLMGICLVVDKEVEGLDTEVITDDDVTEAVLDDEEAVVVEDCC